MKVKMEKDYRKFYTLEDLDHAKAVIAYEKDDEMSIKEWAEYAINEAIKYDCDHIEEIIKAEAHTAKNRRIWDAYADNTQDMDVWIDAVAETGKGFIKVGAYLSDIWQTGANNYREYEYIRYYREVE